MARYAIGIVGNGADKFTKAGRKRAISTILKIIQKEEPTHVVSGHSPMGGIDLWAEDCGKLYGAKLDLKIPEVDRWEPGYGYKARNLDIAADSDKLYVILADVYPANYKGRRFSLCYHCKTIDHVKSGGCWTGHKAKALGREVEWVIINNY